MIENRWNTLQIDVWSKIFRDNFTFQELRNPFLVCKFWQKSILSKTVGIPLMNREDVEFVPGESWFKTFSNRKIVVALDCSWSMTGGTENWRYSLALAEVKALTTKFRNFAAAKGVLFMPFAKTSRAIVINQVEEIDSEMEAINADRAETIGDSNDWLDTFQAIAQQINNCGNKRPTIYLLSDLEVSRSSMMHSLWTKIFEVPPKMFFCRIGNANMGKEFGEFVHNTDDVEAPAKKQRTKGNMLIFYKHISTNQSSDAEFVLSHTPTQIIEPDDPVVGGGIDNLYEPMDVNYDEDEDEDEALEPTAVDDDQPYHPPNDYMDSSSEY